MQSSLTEATSGSVHVFRKWMSERAVQQGCLPAGKICFAVLKGTTAGTPRMQGRELREDSLFVLRGGEEFTIQRPKGMELLAVTFEAEDFLRLLDERSWPAPARALMSRSALRASPRSLQRLRRELLAILAWPSLAPASTTAPICDPAASQVVFEALGELFDEATGAEQALGSASAAFTIAQCHRIVAGGGESPPSIDALCRRLRISRRTLQNSFRQVADTTPVHYLRSLQMNVVRRRLMSTRQAELSVSQAAADQGFVRKIAVADRSLGELNPEPAKPDQRRVASAVSDLVRGHAQPMAGDSALANAEHQPLLRADTRRRWRLG